MENANLSTIFISFGLNGGLITVANAARAARQQAKAQAFIDNLPSRAAVKTAIDAAFPDTKQNRIVTRLADVIYWMVWDKED